MRSQRSTHNMIAVSAYARESAINAEQTLDLTLPGAGDSMIDLETRRESNADEANGKEEADYMYDNGGVSNLSLSFDKAQPQHYGILYGFALGNVVSTAAGIGYLHTITPIDGDLDIARSNPSLTAAQRYGKTVGKELYASMFVDSVTAAYAKDSFCKLTGTLKGTGKVTRSVIEEEISALPTATTFTLAENGVQGTTAAERMDSIHWIRAELTSGVWTTVEFSAVSSATPAEITITAPGAGSTAVNYKILYAPTADAWQTFPARVSETPLRVSEITFRIGGKWDGTAFVGGREMGPEINSIEHSFNNNGSIEFTPGAGGVYASRYWRDGRKQTLSLDREFRDYILQNYMHTNETFGVSILAEGMVFDKDAGHKYSVQTIFPMVGVQKAPRSVGSKRLAEKGEIVVMEDSTYGSVIVKVKNLQATYAAAA